MVETGVNFYFNIKCAEIYVSDCLAKFMFSCSFCTKNYLNYSQLCDHLRNTHFENEEKTCDDFNIAKQSDEPLSVNDIIEEVDYESDDFVGPDFENEFEVELIDAANIEHLEKDECELQFDQTLHEIETQSDLESDPETAVNITNNASELETDILAIDVTCPANKSDYYISEEDDIEKDSNQSETVDPLEELAGRQFKISTSRPFVVELLNKYKNLPILWDPNDEGYYSKNKDGAYAELVHVYNKFNLEANKDLVKRKVQSLRNSFRKELKFKKSIESKGEKYVPKHKYFKNMTFLLGIDDLNSEESESSDSNDDNDKIGVRGLVQNSKFVKEFIDIYKESVVLWKRSDPVYQNSQLKKAAYDKLIDKYKQYDIENGDLLHVLRKIKSLRMSFRKVLDRKKLALSTGHFFESNFKYFNQMMFLANEVRSKEQEREECDEDFKHINLECVRSIESVKNFIALVKSLPSLWDPTNSGYLQHGEANKNVLRTLVNKYKECNSTAQVDFESVQIKWQTLLSAFEEEIRKEQAAKAKGVTYNPTFQYFNDMLFLKPVIEFELNDIGNNESLEKILKINNQVKASFNKMINCDRCKRTFATESRYKYHQMSHDGIFSCDVCDEKFKKLFDLRRHKKIHGMEKAYECETCDKKFSCKYSLNLHKNTHLSTDERPFKCDYCGNKFATKGNYLVHLKRHESITKFKCVTCNKAFVTSTELQAHSYTHKNMKQYICDSCGKDFKQRICFQNHVRKMHGTAEPQYKCNLCNKSYYTSKSLNNHKAGHNKVRKYICEKCDAKFHTRYNFTLHMRSHMTVKMFVCDICQKGFNQACVLRNHIKNKHD